MTKRKLEKIRKQYEELDFSRWHILGYDELLKINGGSSASSDDDDEESESLTEDESGKTNDDEATAETASESGGHEIENTVEAVANAEVGDTLTRDDGTQVTITQGDIDWAQEHCGSGEDKDDETPESKSGEDVTEAMPPEEESAQSSDDADTAEQGALSGDEKSSSADSKSDSRQNEGAAEGKSDVKEGASSKETNSSKENGNAKESNSGKESSNAKENASSSKKSDSPDLVERARQRDEELAARKNSELNSPSKNNSSKDSHGFLDTVVSFISGAKTFACDLFGIGGASVTNKTGDTIVVRPEDPKISPYSLLKNGDTYKGKIDGIIFPDGSVKKTSGNATYVAAPDGKGSYKVSGGEKVDSLLNEGKSMKNGIRDGLESLGLTFLSSKLREEDMFDTYHYGDGSSSFLESWLNNDKSFDINNDNYSDTSFVPIPRNSDGGIPSQSETLDRWNGLSGR